MWRLPSSSSPHCRQTSGSRNSQTRNTAMTGTSVITGLWQPVANLRDGASGSRGQFHNNLLLSRGMYRYGHSFRVGALQEQQTIRRFAQEKVFVNGPIILERRGCRRERNDLVESHFVREHPIKLLPRRFSRSPFHHVSDGSRRH